MNKKDMILKVRDYLSKFGAFDERIIDAMNVVDRGKFYPFDDKVYEDSAQPIGKGQTISQPSCVARMLDLLKLEKGSYVLEVGAGSGWMASLISYLVKPGKVLSLDFHDELVEVARKNSGEFGLDENLEIENQDFWDLIEKFDRIVFSCGIKKEEEAEITKWVKKHLKKNGRAVIPFENGPLILFYNNCGNVEKEYTDEKYSFVPLFS